MLHKTRGIALNYIRYRESSIIAKVYTEAFGIQSYIVNGVRSSRSKSNRIALFQPLTLLDLVVYHKSKEATLHRISEIRCYHPFHSIPFDVIKSSIALFVTEFLVKTLQEEETNPRLFNFLEETLLYLDTAESGYENLHLHFLVQQASFLGFGMETATDLVDQLKENHYSYLPDAVQHAALQTFLEKPYGTQVVLDNERRRSLLTSIVFFYKIHLDTIGEMKSLDVLQEVLR
jgi:DNA repair protein RecO (recombination protein O)